MKGNVYGYLIGSDIQIDIGAGTVTRIYLSRKLNTHSTEAIFLGVTPMSLLVYLLARVDHEVIHYGDILHDVWDVRGLISSYKRMGQVIKELKEKLAMMGLSGEIISTVRGVGYRLNLPEVTCLRYEVISVAECQLTV
ncbi:winged helix-turn-helix domain-containing protein [Serratia fonticola]|uniref:winged helix-turn-helix domain-containing protein n=1 Tax=Serratia fonticola TaxID=47917 RepID=UPI0015C684E9|nr:helix-turn-helix domain-containing protein [Serratia fonticola]MBC3381139.1 winged helix-turn-helix domain-containing protein [Serratia fonticola]NYA40338.1 winged helix-turn-helix domain-containing protein [Serratia fonticola]